MKVNKSVFSHLLVNMVLANTQSDFFLRQAREGVGEQTFFTVERLFRKIGGH
jgi:hypothetical protein